MHFTRKAKEKIIEIAGAEKIVDHPIVRIKILSGGCAGFQYDMAFLDSHEIYDPNNDEIYEMGEFTVVVDSISHQYVVDAEVDWLSDGALSEGFKFNNPAVSSSCGCGNSVSF